MTGIRIKVGLGDGMYLLNPKDDITPLEAVNISIFLTYITAPGAQYFKPDNSRREFIELQGLWRHFDKEIKDGN